MAVEEVHQYTQCPEKNSWSTPFNLSTYGPIVISTLALPTSTFTTSYNLSSIHMDKIATTVLSNNRNHIKLPWDPMTPLEMLIDQIEECIEFATTRNLPFTVAQILNTAYNVVFNTGSFSKTVRSGMLPKQQEHMRQLQNTLPTSPECAVATTTNCPNVWLHVH